MSDAFIGEIRLFAGNFAPTGWAQCHGQLMAISQNTALFSILGTWYGGDGRSTFGLPDLQGSVPIGTGQSTTGSQYDLGQTGGAEYVTLLESEIPFHTHAVQTTGYPADLRAPGPDRLLGMTDGATPYHTSTTNLVQLDPLATSVAGSSLPHNNMQPYLTVNYCIALQGTFPPRG